MDSTPPQMYYT